jgi:2-C-methyl-D-erythritol 2,4-cyclodiphosphate synthase
MSTSTPNFRVGIGYDVHQLVTGRPLIIGGVEIPHSHGLDGHSDADVLCHAIADAILGALGEPDIGHYFPPTDQSIKGISSLDILKKIRSVADEKEFTICNVDSTLIAEAPKVLPHAAAMKERIASALGISPAQVGIKATTNETMGFAGRGEGMAAHAVAALMSQGVS